MRLNILLSPSQNIIPFDYQEKLIYAFHKWIGWNEFHDDVSLYSLSWLVGARMTNKGFKFPSGAKWFISCWNNEIASLLMAGVMKDPEVLNGMKVEQVQMQETPNFGSRERFSLASPILIRKYDDNKKAIHLTFKDDEANKYLTDTIKRKMKKAGLEHDVNIRFDNNYTNAKTKLVKINGIGNKANYCPVIIEGDPEAIKFAWNVGIGHSTGCCFGAVR